MEKEEMVKAVINGRKSNDYMVTRDGRIYNVKRKRYQTAYRANLTDDGKFDLMVSLTIPTDNGRSRRRLCTIKKLVLDSFRVKPTKKGSRMFIEYLDGNCMNCSLDNLKWVPLSERLEVVYEDYHKKLEAMPKNYIHMKGCSNIIYLYSKVCKEFYYNTDIYCDIARKFDVDYRQVSALIQEKITDRYTNESFVEKWCRENKVPVEKFRDKVKGKLAWNNKSRGQIIMNCEKENIRLQELMIHKETIKWIKKIFGK